MAAVEDEDGGQIPPDVQSIDRGGGGFRCLLCGVNIPNRPSLNDHLQGRRHKRLCEERDKRQQQQERSVFVSGFSKDISEDQIKEVFEKIFPVKHIVMDKDRGLYAIVEFESQDGVCQALSETVITLEGHRLKVKPREKKEFKNKKGGTPRNLQPPDPETLSKQLIRCTDVEDQIKNLVSLCSPSHHESRLRELLLSLLRETFTEFFPGCQLLPFGSSVNGFEISGCDLDLHLELGENDRNEKDDLNIENEKMEAKLESIDKDLSGEHVVQDNELEEEPSPKKDGEELVMQVTEADDDDENITPGLSLLGLSQEEILEVVGRVLRQCVPGVHGVQSVPSARRPVIRFQHKTSGLRGDITLNNRLALRNSSYLRLCSDLDPRVPQLVYTVRYWARVHQLAGNPLGGGPLLNNYALTLMVIFFLQTRSPPVIQSLSRMREIALDDASHVIDGWDCSFISDSTQFPVSENQQSLSSLLSEFFCYFSSLDLHSHILCPHDGLLASVPVSSPIWAEGFRVGSLNVQDPFELNHNVCGNVSSRIARRFSVQCSAAAKACRTPLYQLRSASRPWGIILLIQSSTSEGEKAEGADISISTGKASVEEVFLAVKTVLVEVLLCSCKQDSEKDGCSVKSREESDQDVPCVGELFIDDKGSEMKEENMSEDGLKNERKRESPEEIQSSSPKRRRLEDDGSDCVNDQQNNLSEKNLSKMENASKTPKSPTKGVLSMKIDVWHHVWEGRRKMRRSMQGKVVQGMQLETAVSQALSAGTIEGGSPLMQMTVTAHLGPEGNARLHLSPDSDDYDCSAVFFHFLKIFLPRMVEEVLTGKD
ncbi:speckle targeted PIP5K1A-regulated poly(A) polymerase [Bufo bufo]|uniref:speckle targeted PIP5K1A-regulated poly(A) polymerase n=1 Tax=Bufo bufo TaxID=8384 RepID=UPI001ABE3111|nr:speckle targeted PIP5K1A-regulated poly(A) polymerase [Bufo bufo]